MIDLIDLLINDYELLIIFIQIFIMKSTNKLMRKIEYVPFYIFYDCVKEYLNEDIWWLIYNYSMPNLIQMINV